MFISMSHQSIILYKSNITLSTLISLANIGPMRHDGTFCLCSETYKFEVFLSSFWIMFPSCVHTQSSFRFTDKCTIFTLENGLVGNFIQVVIYNFTIFRIILCINLCLVVDIYDCMKYIDGFLQVYIFLNHSLWY